MPSTVTRMLLNHFRWDKEKLMERYYDGDQEKLFCEARVVNPFAKPVAKAVKKVNRRPGPNVEECEVSWFTAVSFLLVKCNVCLFEGLCIHIAIVCDVWFGVRPQILPYMLD